MKESRNRNRNLAASVRQRLKNLATAQREDFQAILTRYALERFLYRLSQSPEGDRIIELVEMILQLEGL